MMVLSSTIVIANKPQLCSYSSLYSSGSRYIKNLREGCHVTCSFCSYYVRGNIFIQMDLIVTNKNKQVGKIVCVQLKYKNPFIGSINQNMGVLESKCFVSLVHTQSFCVPPVLTKSCALLCILINKIDVFARLGQWRPSYVRG